MTMVNYFARNELRHADAAVFCLSKQMSGVPTGKFEYLFGERLELKTFPDCDRLVNPTSAVHRSIQKTGIAH
jgi:hypothetical protein